jgi:hypothetical protein
VSGSTILPGSAAGQAGPDDWILAPVRETGTGWLAHVFCEGARYHLIAWDNRGPHCSEKRCEINRAPTQARGVLGPTQGSERT